MSLIGQAYKQVTRFIQWVLHSKLNKTMEIAIKTRLGIPMRYHSPARLIFEKFILPNIASQGHNHEKSRVLFVGCDWYTKHYKNEFFKAWDYWTIDPDCTKKRYGSKNHVIGHLENLSKYFGPEYFDMIICNGVMGYGLNQHRQVEDAFNSCYTCLRIGGKMIIGRENEPAFIPFSNDEIVSLTKFVPYFFTPLGTSDYCIKTGTNYTFSFFKKPSHALTEAPQINFEEHEIFKNHNTKTVDNSLQRTPRI